MKKLTALTLIVLSSLVLSSVAFADGYLNDPMAIGVGARALGMGKAYVAMAEDGDTIFMNPAGLGRITNPKLTSMYSRSWAMSITSSSAAPSRTAKSRPSAWACQFPVADIPLTDSTGAPLGSGGWGNNVVFVSYGTYLNALPVLSLNLDRDVLVGGSLKYFSVGGDGSGVSDASGTGMDIDLGALYPITDYMMVGVNAMNILPASLGAKITKSTGQADSIPSTIKVGTKVTLIGQEGTALAAHDTRRLYGNLDYDFSPTGARPGAVHAGVEFWPTGNLALRAGLDDKDPTAGVGIRVAGLEFDYAYHPYSGISENTTQYFSIGYLGEPRKRELKITLDEPKDKGIIYEDHVTVKGRVDVKEGDEPAPKGPISLKLNGAIVAVKPDGTFNAELPVEKYGKKLIQAEASDNSGNSANLEARLVRLTIVRRRAGRLLGQKADREQRHGRPGPRLSGRQLQAGTGLYPRRAGDPARPRQGDQAPRRPGAPDLQGREAGLLGGQVHRSRAARRAGQGLSRQNVPAEQQDQQGRRDRPHGPLRRSEVSRSRQQAVLGYRHQPLGGQVYPGGQGERNAEVHRTEPAAAERSARPLRVGRDARQDQRWPASRSKISIPGKKVSSPNWRTRPSDQGVARLTPT